MIRTPTFPFFALREEVSFIHGFTEPKELEILGAYTSFTLFEMLDHFGDELTSLQHHPFQELYRINSTDGLTLRITKHNRNDAGFIAWMEGFVLQNQDNPYVPKVHSYARFNTGKTITIMEELTLLPNNKGINGELQTLTVSLIVSGDNDIAHPAARRGYDEEAMVDALTFIKQRSEISTTILPFLGNKSCLYRQDQFVFLDPLGD